MGGKECAVPPLPIAREEGLLLHMVTLLPQICLLILATPSQDFGVVSELAKGGETDEAESVGSWAADFAGDLLTDLFSALPWDWQGGLAVDGTLGWRDRGGRDHAYAHLRSAEVNLNGHISEALETHVALHATRRHVELDHLTLAYTDLPGDGSLHFGRMPLRFGSQMHLHVHELSTASRPRVLEEYLGTTLTTSGVHYDSFLMEGQGKSLRLFAGAFGSMDSELHGRGGDRSRGGQELEAVGLSARLVGSGIPAGAGDLRLGASWRTLPDYTLSVRGAGAATGLSNRIIGLDAEFSPTAAEWTLGLEYLQMNGDLGGSDDTGSGLIDLVAGSRAGWLLSYDRPLSEKTSLGLTLSDFEHLDAGADHETEVAAAWSWQAAGFLRIRLAASQQVSDSEDDVTRIMLQLTGVIGSHDHDHGHEHRH
jgi:hypothetical protein